MSILIDVERRQRPALGNVELRSAAGGETRLSGLAAVFNSPTVIGGYFIEKLAPGCFANSLLSGDARMLFNHDVNFLLGRRSAGTLKLAEDGKGLRFELIPPDTTCGRDVVENVKLGNLDGMSFAFQSVRETWDDTGDMPVRTIEELDLFEISAVVNPAYKDTTLGIRSGKTNSPFKEIPPAAVIAAMQRMKAGLVQRERHHVFH